MLRDQDKPGDTGKTNLHILDDENKPDHQRCRLLIIEPASSAGGETVCRPAPTLPVDPV
jgi:hypothetical protein